MMFITGGTLVCSRVSSPQAITVPAAEADEDTTEMNAIAPKQTNMETVLFNTCKSSLMLPADLFLQPTLRRGAGASGIHLVVDTRPSSPSCLDKLLGTHQLSCEVHAGQFHCFTDDFGLSYC